MSGLASAGLPCSWLVVEIRCRVTRQLLVGENVLLKEKLTSRFTNTNPSLSCSREINSRHSENFPAIGCLGEGIKTSRICLFDEPMMASQSAPTFTLGCASWSMRRILHDKYISRVDHEESN